MEQIHESRFFSDWYDSVRQRGFSIVEKEFSEISKLYIARLRFDALLSKTIVMTDAQLLDGAFILSENPTDLRDSLKRSRYEPIPIEVRSRANNLSDALVAFIKNPKNENLKGFTFSSVEKEEDRKHLKIRLESTKIKEVNNWKDILKIMRSAKINEENIERIEQGWAKWIEAQEKRIIVVKKWDGQFDLDTSIGALLKPELATPEGNDAAAWVDRNKDNRNAVDTQLDGLKEEYELTNNENAVKDILAIKAWFYSAYNHALSRQHGCGNFETVFGMSSVFSQPNAQEQLDLPNHFWERLATLPDNDFTTLFYDKSRLFEKWWAEGKPVDLKKAMEPLLKKIIENKTPLDVTPLSKIIYGGAASVFPAIIGLFSAGLPGLIGGAIVGGSGALALEQLTVHLHYRPVKKISQRIMKIAKERKNAKQNNNN